MNYELAKKLKDAGFPQTVPYTARNFKTSDPDRIGGIYESCVVPTLSELIEAIVGSGKRNTFGLDYDEEWSFYEPRNESGPWSARYYDITPVGFYESGAETPEEAVALLWIKLNGK